MGRLVEKRSVLFLLLLSVLGACSPAGQFDLQLTEEQPGIRSAVDSATYDTGVLLYNADQGREFWTEFNTQMRPYWTGEARASFRRALQEANPYLICTASRGAGDFGLRMASFRTLFDDDLLPASLATRVRGLSFNALGYDQQLLKVEVRDAQGRQIAVEYFELEDGVFRTYSLPFENTEVKEIVFSTSTAGVADSTRFALDDLYLKTEDSQPFVPPASDQAFLDWLKRSSLHFFDWNYISLSGEQGLVLESYLDAEKVSLSGLGYAYAVFVLAAEEGYLTAEEAKQRVKAMLNWQVAQNWFDGSGGWHGFPHHYFRKDGTFYWADVSTIDWAICAAGIRVARQYYADDPEIVAIADTLLARPDWMQALADDDKIAMGFNGENGQMNDYRWGLAFSEETELVYLEAVASGDLDARVFTGIIRERKSGFYPSWFGAGFTYNWLQLWTGPLQPFQANAKVAYEMDAAASLKAFDQPLMGLTACSTVKEVSPEGFLRWDQYISNQGGAVHGARLGEVIRVSPAPYGAALALPFTDQKAMRALRAYVDLGYYHEYLGLPDNVRIEDLPEGQPPAPNWNPFDINIGPLLLAIEQVQANRIGPLYLSDTAIQKSLDDLLSSFE